MLQIWGQEIGVDHFEPIVAAPQLAQMKHPHARRQTVQLVTF